MASTERSLGWTTGVAGTDGASAYDQTRFITMQQKLNAANGVLNTSNLLACSGETTSTLTIADGAAIIGGFFYESNGNITISTTGLTGSYSVIIFSNSNAAAQTVSANGAGTTTVASGTTRAAIVTSAQLTTITTNVTAANIITIATLSITAGTISTITQQSVPARETSFTSNSLATMQMSSSINLSTGVTTTLTPYASLANSADGTITCNTATGVITCSNTSVVLVDAQIIWDGNTTGARSITIQTGYSPENEFWWTPSASYSNQVQRIIAMCPLASVRTLYLRAYQNSGGTRAVTVAQLRVMRAI